MLKRIDAKDDDFEEIKVLKLCNYKFFRRILSFFPRFRLLVPFYLHIFALPKLELHLLFLLNFILSLWAMLR